MPTDTVVIKVGQLRPDGEALTEIGAWVIDAPVWGQIQRVIPLTVPSDTPGCIWIDLCDNDGDMIAEAPYVIAAHHGQWLLRDWLKPQPREWKKVRVPQE